MKAFQSEGSGWKHLPDQQQASMTNAWINQRWDSEWENSVSFPCHTHRHNTRLILYINIELYTIWEIFWEKNIYTLLRKSLECMFLMIWNAFCYRCTWCKDACKNIRQHITLHSTIYFHIPEMRYIKGSPQISRHRLKTCHNSDTNKS